MSDPIGKSPVRFCLTEDEYWQLERAIDLQLQPDDWRDSEYAMTKLHARGCIGQIEPNRGSILPAFSVSLLLGEVARAYLFDSHPALLSLYIKLDEALMQSPELRIWRLRCAAISKAAEKIKQLDERRSALQATLDRAVRSERRAAGR